MPDQARPLLEECRVDTINPQISVLDEFKLRDELKAMRAQIPDAPGLNPIVNIGFYLSRSLESGTISFEDLKALAGRLMDRACVRCHKVCGSADEMVKRRWLVPGKPEGSPVYTIIGKHRNGPTGSIDLIFMDHLAKFMDAETRNWDLTKV